MSWRNQKPTNRSRGQHCSLVLKVSLLLIGITACSGRNSDTQSVEETMSIEVATTTVVTSTTLSVAEQTAADEQLFREMLYSGQQEFSQLTGSKAEKEAHDQWQVENMFPPYREFLNPKLETCLDSSGYGDTGLYTDYGVLELGSSFPTPDWKLEISLPDGGIKTFQPSDYGRTYLARVTFKSSTGEESESDIHFTIIDGRAYWFPNFDDCL